MMNSSNSDLYKILNKYKIHFIRPTEKVIVFVLGVIKMEMVAI